MQSPSSARRRRTAANGGFLIAALLAWPAVSNAQTTPPPTGQSAQAATGQPTAEERETWRKELMAVPRPTKGCFTATYPERQWRSVPCKAPPNKPYFPQTGGMTRMQTVGGAGPDFVASVTGHITQADGSFDSVTGVTATPAYSLQLNTDFFPTSTCSTSTNAGCRGWEQFVYELGGTGFIQYWLINFGKSTATCPAPVSAHCDGSHVFTDGWCPFILGSSANPLFCAVNAANGVASTAEPATSLALMRVHGAAAGVNGATADAVTVTAAGTAVSASGDNRFPDLGTAWKEAEFNVFGDGGGSQAVFNSGASATVRIGVDSGTSSGPGCDLRSFTAESTNLTLQNTPPTAAPGPLPALVFAQTDPAPAGAAADCTDAVSLGDTHLTTFNGLHYDFQASGDFLLAQSGPDFVVQTRQASGAPTWPNAAVNKAVATRMGRTDVAICLAPARLLVNGKPRLLADQHSISLPDEITVSRAGDLYVIQRINGDSVRAQLNPGSQPRYDWMDVKVYLGDRSQIPNVRGLLGNPDGDRNLLRLSDGTILKEPVSFETLYHRYGDSWRVPVRDSLLCKIGKVRYSNPSRPFYANDLTQAQQDRARAVCAKAGVKQEAALADCTLDVTVLGTSRAAAGLARAPIPGAVFQAGYGNSR